MERREQHARPAPEPAPHIRMLIERAAYGQHVHPRAALLFAELESGFNPFAYTASDWADAHPGHWQALRRRMPRNPAIDNPAAWGKYGLFGLLAAYHVRPTEHPHVLWNAAVNATRGIAAVRLALERARGDMRTARLLYLGCGADGSLCSPAHVAQIDARLIDAAERWLDLP